jgi:hypothetical protein
MVCQYRPKLVEYANQGGCTPEEVVMCSLLLSRQKGQFQALQSQVSSAGFLINELHGYRQLIRVPGART